MKKYPFIFIILLTFSGQLLADEKQALNAMATLGGKLQQELSKAMRKSPVNAVEVCKIKAPEIAKAVSSDKMKIGRVSLKNRNPDNYPKDWMLPTIKKYHAKEIDNPYVVVPLEGNKKGVLKPIITMPLCTKCHGTEIAPEVKSKITALYPKDKATGFKPGDIRGFFWAEY